MKDEIKAKRRRQRWLSSVSLGFIKTRLSQCKAQPNDYRIMNKTRIVLVIVLVLVSTHRSPAPIQEVPQSPTPGPTVAPVAQPIKSPPKPKSKPSGAARFAGTWTGRITIDKFADTDVRLVISTDGRSVAQTSQAGVWTRPLAYDGKLLSWQTGPTNAVAWTLALNPNEQSALVTRIWSGVQTRGIFKRAR
jgi:hypothetical protein